MTSAATGRIVTPDHRATRIGQDLLDAGATAADAVVAASAALCVVYPQNVTLGGDTWTLVATPGTGPVAINGTGRSPAALSADALRDRGHTEMPATGPHSITVPGLVAAWGALHQQWGRTAFAELVAPAVRLAQQGSPIAPVLGRDLGQQADLLGTDPGLAAVFFGADGSALAPGDLLLQPALADSLSQIAADGPQALYGGDVGRRYVEGLQRAGSLITIDDLDSHRTEQVDPIGVGFGGVEVLTTPPSSQGFALLKTLALMTELGLDDPGRADQAMMILEAAALAGQERDRLSADPDAVGVDLDGLLDPATVGRQAADLLGGRTPPASAAPTAALGGDTIGIVAVDADGCWVSSVQSVAGSFGSRVLEPSTGILAHNRGSGFSLDPQLPGFLAGGRRPPHTLMPALVRDRDRVVGALATMGGRNQPFILTQVLCRILAGDHPQQAVAAPRWVVQRPDSDDRLVLADERLPGEVITTLASAAPTETVPMADNRLGHSHALWLDDGGWTAGTDPRADGRDPA